ncbi:hypothetical protein [Aminipila terrae]|uniref:Zinc-binding metallo-peptidase n=1 Tax=Aminipila terrae TaxID=2697030 RepID=A0A6P1MDR3_9FIRM|nr:hypothetical protein [Aminipila terrae]QHI72047.1 hypothetical protein Ami3637_06235 [Aminipila terrae]
MKKKVGNKVFILILFCLILLVVTCTDSVSGKLELSKEENVQLTALLGDLNENATEQVRSDVGTLLHKADILMQEREGKKDYKMSDKETEIWQKITALLDKETIRQFGEDNYKEDKPDPKLDYGKETMANLKKILSRKDWDKLNQLREEYFKATENDDEQYDVDINKEIKDIVGKYRKLDADAIALNLLDDKNQKNFGMFVITPAFNAVYQEGSQNGLDSLSKKEQKNLEKNWKAVTDILPKELFANFKYFKVGGDGELGTYAYVIPVDDQGKTWCMTVDPADIKDDGLFPYTVVHEMCHYLTLNEKQVEYFGDNEKYYPENRYSDWECVANEDSYLQAYYKAFWKDMINDWATDPENAYFYDRHKSEFVTGYASTECAEDLAESFCAYVFLKSADTPGVQAKFDFFDRYPELKQLKQQILKKVKANHVYVNPEIEPDDGKIFDDAA